MTSCLAARSAWKYLSELMAPLRFCEGWRAKWATLRKRGYSCLWGAYYNSSMGVSCDCRMRILLSFQITQISKHQNQALIVSIVWLVGIFWILRCDSRAKNPRAALTICPLLSIAVEPCEVLKASALIDREVFQSSKSVEMADLQQITCNKY